MSFWKKLSVLCCVFRGHDWSGCLCSRCGAREDPNSSLHDWDDWSYVQEGSCWKKARCTRCGRTTTELSHQWGPGEIIDTGVGLGIGSLAAIHRCRRCGETWTERPGG